MLTLRIKLLLTVLLAVAPSLAFIVHDGLEERELGSVEAHRDAANYARMIAAEQEADTDRTRRWVSDFAQDLHLPAGTVAAVISRQGQVLLRYPEGGNWIGRDAAGSPIVRRILADPTGERLHMKGIDGIERIHAWRPLDPGNGGDQSILVVAIPLSTIEDGMFGRISFNLAGAGLALLLALGIAWRMGERVVMLPLSRLVAATAPYADGSLPRDAAPEKHHDELAQLQRTFEQVATTVAQQQALVAVKDLIESQNDMLQAVCESQKAFIDSADPRGAFRTLLEHIVRLTESRFGLIAALDIDAHGRPVLRPLAPGRGASRDAPPGSEQAEGLHGLDSLDPAALAGTASSGCEALVINDAAGDPRVSGLPGLHAFMGLPLCRGEVPVGLVALANRAEGYNEELAEGLRPLLDTAAALLGALRNEERRRDAEARLRRLNDELDERVQERTAQLQASLQELEGFSYSISHDLRAPLRGINGFARILSEDYGDRLDDEARSHLKRIGTAAVHMGELIDQLIELARLTRMPLQQTDVDLSAMARALVHELRQLEPERGIEFVVADGLRAQCDARLMRVALGNLFGNAWKYTALRAEARIEFGRCERDGDAAFFVRDNGAGFDMAFVGKLFKPFQRLHQQEEFQGGAGIGLATVRRVVLRHGGRAWGEGALGQGASFYFTLP